MTMRSFRHCCGVDPVVYDAEILGIHPPINSAERQRSRSLRLTRGQSADKARAVKHEQKKKRALEKKSSTLKAPFTAASRGASREESASCLGLDVKIHLAQPSEAEVLEDSEKPTESAALPQEVPEADNESLPQAVPEDDNESLPQAEQADRAISSVPVVVISPVSAGTKVEKHSSEAPKLARAKGKARGKNHLRSGNQVVKAAVGASSTGLRTKDQSQMVEKLEPSMEKYFSVAGDFLREFINSPPDSNTMAREAAVFIFTAGLASSLRETEGRNPAATCSHFLSLNVGGSPALRTKKIEAVIPQCEFYVSKVFRPLLDALENGTVWPSAEDIAADTKFAIGSKPEFLAERLGWIDKLNNRSIFTHDWTSAELYATTLKEQSIAWLDDISQSLVDCKKTGSNFINTINSV